MPAVYNPRRPRASPLWQIVTAAWIATSVCHEVPHRQFVLTPSPPAQSALAGQPSGLSVSPAPRRARLTIPRVLRGIFRKRRDLLHILFQAVTETLRDSFRTRLNLPAGRIGAIAAVHTF